MAVFPGEHPGEMTTGGDEKKEKERFECFSFSLFFFKVRAPTLSGPGARPPSVSYFLRSLYSVVVDGNEDGGGEGRPQPTAQPRTPGAASRAEHSDSTATRAASARRSSLSSRVS